MACMDRVMELNFRSTDEDAYFQESHDWSLKHVFQDPRNTEAIKAGELGTGAGWRMKERMKTVSVALVLCLNVGVDPPGVIKLQPCARLECWVDPLSPAISPQKALEQIGQNLQKQYERWQPRARYKQSLDPTVDEVKKLCTSLRRNAKEERVLFHFVGHGVPAPTTNGEIWVFNRNYTQYIPLSIYDLQTWMGYPSIYVFDCNNAGIIVKSFHQFAEQHEREFYSEADKKNNDEEHSTAPNFSACILLGACGENQLLPMNPDLPADLFTSCLTTPIRTSLRWFVLQNQGSSKNSKVPANKLLAEGITLETVERVPGQLNDRRTMLGEINWIFTAITDTIAFQHLPKHLFQKLFRQDLLVASLFRNFLLAERIMRSYQVTPVSSPRLPPTYQNEMWHAWDYALDQCLSQLKSRESSPPEVFPHTPSPFFEEQLTAFEVWLELGNEKRRPPEQLPIVLQVLLSQVHRVRALELLGKFLNLGSWAVNLALSVGIFPYVLKLLQSSAKELRSLLVYIWAKILAVDGSCKSDLTRENSHRYFINLITDNGLSTEHRTYAVFVLCNIVRNYSAGQQAALQANSIATCLFALEDPDNETPDVSNLHKWVCICLGLTWQDFPSARWCGVRDSAHEKIGRLLDHEHPEVRAAAVFALGCFVNGIERTEHSSAIDHAVILMVLNKLANEASSLVRQEIVVALHNFVLVFENQFVILAEKQAVVESQQGFASPGLGSLMSPGTLRTRNNRMRALLSNDRSGMTITGGENPYGGGAGDSMRRVASSSSLSNLMNVFIPPAAVGLPTSAVNQMTPQSPTPGTSNTLSSIYSRVFNHIVQYERDPHPGVAILSRTVLEYIRSKAIAKSHQKNALKEMESSGESARSGQSPKAATPTPTPTPTCITPIIATKFIDWCWSQVCKPSIAAQDPQDPNVCVRSWVYGRNARIRRDCFKRVKVFPGKIEDQVVSKSLSEVVRPGGSVVRFHGYENLVVVGGPAVLETPSSANSSASGSLTSLESTRTNTHVVTDKSVFLVFEYDDSSALSATHDQSPSGATPQQPSSPSTTAARLLNKTEIEHTNGGFNSGSPFISAIEWLNAHDTITTSSSSLISTGCNDGCVRVYKPNTEAKCSSLVTAWSVSPASRVHGLKMRYQVEATNLVVGFHGHRNTHVLVYDCEAERMVREIGQVDKNQSSVFGEWWLSAMDCNRSEPNVFVLGGDDGSVKLLDFRLPVTEAITQTWRDFSNPTDRTSSSVQTVRLRYDRTVVSGNSNGRVRFFDLRSKTPTKTIDTTTDVTSLDIHANLPYFGIGTSSGVLNVFGFQSQTGFLANSIREGFAGFGRIGLASNSISSVAFHDFKPFVAFVDSYSHFSVYKARK